MRAVVVVEDVAARRRHGVEREAQRVALASGIGLFIGSQPWFGLKTLICLAVARPLRLQPLVVMAFSSLTTPPVGFAVWTMSIIVGNVLLHGTLPRADQYDVAQLGAGPVFTKLAIEWIVGAIAVGAALGFIAWTIMRLLLRRGSDDAVAIHEPA